MKDVFLYLKMILLCFHISFTIFEYKMQSKKEILHNFGTTWAELSGIINETDENIFNHKSSPQVWSIAEEFEHIIKSASAVSSAMKVSPFILKWKFGKPNRPIRTYNAILTKYTTALASVDGRAVAPSPFRAQEGKALYKSEMLTHWNSTLAKFDQRITKWSDKNLDKVLLPHPLLGKMMVREMLYFTQIHTEHHLASLKRKVAAIS